MRFGIMFANTGPAVEGDHAVELGRRAEQAGFESIWTVEHVVVPSGYESAYPYSPDGKMPGGEDSPIPDPLIWLAYVAAATTRIKLATGILILPQRNPLILAKEIATLDRLSGGRMVLGIGVGWLEEEFRALGVPFEKRGSRADEYVEILRKVWTGRAEHSGDHFSFDELHSHPTPAQGSSIPIVVGGHSEAAARRAGRLADGFFPGRAGEELVHLIKVMRQAAEEAGRDPDAIEITAGGAWDLEGAEKMAEAGVDRLVVPALGRDPEKRLGFLDKFGAEVIGAMA
jgi:probable F420-dependent oxidoreductase